MEGSETEAGMGAGRTGHENDIVVDNQVVILRAELKCEIVPCDRGICNTDVSDIIPSEYPLRRHHRNIMNAEVGGPAQMDAKRHVFFDYGIQKRSFDVQPLKDRWHTGESPVDDRTPIVIVGNFKTQVLEPKRLVFGVIQIHDQSGQIRIGHSWIVFPLQKRFRSARPAEDHPGWNQNGLGQQVGPFRNQDNTPSIRFRQIQCGGDLRIIPAS